MGTKRLNNLNIQISYDDLADVLYISFGDPRPGIASEVNIGDFVRVDPYTNEVLGITILDFKERYMQKTSMSIKESAQNIVSKVLKEFRG
jgi:uncharacterized protein YuzE